MFVYKPEQDELYRKVIVTDVQQDGFFARKLDSEVELPDHRANKIESTRAKMTNASEEYLEAFVSDTKQGVFEIRSILDTKDIPFLQSVLESLYSNYQDLVLLHFEMMSEC